MLQRPHVQKLIERVRAAMPLHVAFVYPCDRDSLQLAVSGAFAGYLSPMLVGPAARIRDTASGGGLYVSQMPIVDTPDDPRAAAQRAIALARKGGVGALVKGALQDEQLLGAVAAADSGLRLDTRLSYASVLDLPGFDRPLVLADARLNVTPPLAAKRDILRNTVGLARAMGIAAPRVALVAAMDGASQAFPSTTEAVALRAMAQQGHFGHATVEGPLTPDQALGRTGERPGAPFDVLLAPAMEPAILLWRTLVALTSGLATGIVLGARVPVVLPARDEPLESRMASCVLATLLATAAPVRDRPAALAAA